MTRVIVKQSSSDLLEFHYVKTTNSQHSKDRPPSLFFLPKPIVSERCLYHTAGQTVPLEEVSKWRQYVGGVEEAVSLTITTRATVSVRPADRCNCRTCFRKNPNGDCSRRTVCTSFDVSWNRKCGRRRPCEYVHGEHSSRRKSFHGLSFGWTQLGRADEQALSQYREYVREEAITEASNRVLDHPRSSERAGCTGGSGELCIQTLLAVLHANAHPRKAVGGDCVFVSLSGVSHVQLLPPPQRDL